MENRVKTIVLGILTLATLAGCSASDDAAGGTDTAPPPAAGGGLDGGGLIGVGLRWDKGVFVQPLWEDGQPRLLVSNRRAEQVSFGVYTIAEWGDDQYGSGNVLRRGALLTEAVVPGHGIHTLDAGALVGAVDDLLWIEVDNERLGLMFRPQPLSMTGTLPVISNDFSALEPFGQLETAFSVLPGTDFEATLTLTHPGELWVEPEPSSSLTADVTFVTPTDATSEEALVTSTTDGFLVAVPAGTSETSPARVQLSFNVPSAVLESSLIVLDPGFYCTDLNDPSGCARGGRVLRIVPAP